MQIKTKILLSFSLVVFLITTTIVIFSINKEKLILNKEIEQDGITFAKIIADHAKQAFLINNYVSLFNYIEFLKNRRNIEYISIKDTSGNTLVDTNIKYINRHLNIKNYIPKLKCNQYYISYSKNNDLYKIFVPVYVDNKLLGYVELGYSLRDLHKKFKYLEYNILIISLIGASLVIILSFILADYITNPINKLKKISEEITHGNFNVDINIESDDEIGQFAATFKTMLNQLKLNILNLTETKELLAQEKEKLAIILNSIADVIITINTKGEILFVNSRAEELIGKSIDELKGKSLKELIIFNSMLPSNTSLTDIALSVIKQKDIIKPPETYSFKDNNNIVHYFSVTCAPIISVYNKILGVVIVLTDITDRKRLEEEQLRSQKIESIAILAGGIAHDFNNILTGILGNISLAKLFADNNYKLIERLDAAEAASIQARELTQQLLIFSKGGAPVKSTTSIAKILEDTVRFSLHGSKVSYELDIDSDLWSADVDISQFNQVINNLIINANQAMPKGGTIYIKAQNTTIDSEKFPFLPSGRYIKIVIQDEGIGIPPEHMGRIFDPYFTTKSQGNGLGLAIVYSIIKRHDGHISVDSIVGKGTKFTIYLPAANKTIKANITDEQNNNTTNTYIKKNAKILIMDDEEIVLDVCEQMIKKLGHRVFTVKNGQELITTYKNAITTGEPFDIVIMDLTIRGGMGGIEAINVLKQIDKNIKAVASSGYSNDPIFAKYKQYGFCAFVTKPYKFEELKKVIDKLLTISAENEMIH